MDRQLPKFFESWADFLKSAQDIRDKDKPGQDDSVEVTYTFADVRFDGQKPNLNPIKISIQELKKLAAQEK